MPILIFEWANCLFLTIVLMKIRFSDFHKVFNTRSFMRTLKNWASRSFGMDLVYERESKLILFVNSNSKLELIGSLLQTVKEEEIKTPSHGEGFYY